MTPRMGSRASTSTKTIARLSERWGHFEYRNRAGRGVQGPGFRKLSAANSGQFAFEKPIRIGLCIGLSIGDLNDSEGLSHQPASLLRIINDKHSPGWFCRCEHSLKTGALFSDRHLVENETGHDLVKLPCPSSEHLAQVAA